MIESKLTHNDVPEALGMVLSELKSIKTELSELKTAAATTKDKGTRLNGIRAISRHFGIGQETVTKLIISCDAPIYQAGKSFFCYTNEMDEFFKIHKK